MSLNILLVNPNILGDPNVPGSYRKARMPSVSLGLGSLAAYVEANSNHKVMIIDARIEGLDPEGAFNKMQDFKPDIVGVSLCSHLSTTWTIPFLQMVKKWKEDIHITLGNHFASLFPEKALTQMAEADSVVIGEGEITFLELITRIAGKQNWKTISSLAWKDSHGQVSVNQRRPFIPDINILPPPKRSLLKNEGENCELVVEGSRGCAFHCSFCTIGPFYGLQEGIALRQKSAKSIFSEIKRICDQYPKLRRVRFVDPEFFIGKEGPSRIEKLAELICAHLPNLQFCVESRASSIVNNVNLLKKLKLAGLARVNMGIESGSQKILDKMKKGTKVEDSIIATTILRELDIDYTYGFMMVTPWSVEEDIEQNASMLEKIGKIELHRFCHELSLIPGTAAFKEIYEEKGLLWKGHNYYFTYTTASKRIERYRKLIATLEKHHNSFFKMAAFIYESIRALFYADSKTLAKEVEKKFDELLLNFFRFFWEAANYELSEEDYLNYAKKCFDLFAKRLEILLKRLDPDIPIPIPSKLLPKFATICQV
jgi:anaerobic magnesium-protoporphyrin IX monomethyl ester cyclase